MDSEELLEIDLSYPGISFGYHSWALGVYLEAVENLVAHAGDQYRLRAQRELETRKEGMDEGEYFQELGLIDEAAEKHIPEYAYMSSILLIWGFFESTVFDITSYVTNRKGVSLKLRDIRANSFQSKVRKYYASVLHLELPWTESQITRIARLHKIRDAIAHRNGNYLDAAHEKKDDVKKLVRSTAGVTSRP